ncbi:MAG: hypothetical protein EOP05_08855, partial [Proteobacteria bacterium]
MNLECEAGLSVAFESPAALTSITPINCNGTAGTNPILNKSFSVAGLADSAAPIDLKLSMTDAVGNKTTKAISLLYKDVVSGTPTITVAKAFTNKFQTFSGTCTVGEGDVKLFMKRAEATDSSKSVACGLDGTWKLEDYDASTLTAADGSMTAKASQTDAAGNSTLTMPSVGFTYDSTLPTGTIIVTNAQQVLNISEAAVVQNIGGACEPGAMLQLSAAPASATASIGSATCSNGGVWFGTVDYRNVPVPTTSSVLQLIVTDLAGNAITLTNTISIDLIAPTPSITTAGLTGFDGRRYINLANVNAVPIFATCEPSITTYVKVTDAAKVIRASKNVGCASSPLSDNLNLSALVEGDFYAAIEQTDAAGNIGSSPSYALTKDTIKPGAPTALVKLQESTSTKLTETPQFTVVSPGDASGIYQYAYRILDASDNLLKANVFTTATAVLPYANLFSVNQSYKLAVSVKDNANNTSSEFTDTWDYCPYSVKVFGPGAGKENADETLSDSFKIPRSCAQGNISIIALGESGRTPGGNYDEFIAGGGLAAGLYSGSQLAGRTLKIDFGGAGLGGRSAFGVNLGAGGRYAWIEDSSDASLVRVVAGGGGGKSGLALDGFYANTPGLGGDSGLGGGSCEDDFGQYRQYCGRNGNANGAGAPGLAGKAGSCNITAQPESGVAGTNSTSSRGKGGNATNPGNGATSDRFSGGGGGGFGGGGAGSNGFTGDCYGRSGGGGGSDVSG